MRYSPKELWFIHAFNSNSAGKHTASRWRNAAGDDFPASKMAFGFVGLGSRLFPKADCRRADFCNRLVAFEGRHKAYPQSNAPRKGGPGGSILCVLVFPLRAAYHCHHSAVAQLGVNVNSIIAAVGAAAVTVGLALKDSMSNIASGVLIIITKPFKAGDFLEFEGLQGTVTKIEIMNTFLNTVDNKEVIIPNSRLTANNVTNFTSHDMRRLDLSYSVGYGDDIVAAKQLLQGLVSEHPLVLKEPEPVVGIADHKDSSISIDCKLWCHKDDYWPLYYEMQEKVKLMFDEHGIHIPFNQLVVHMEPDEVRKQP